MSKQTMHRFRNWGSSTPLAVGEKVTVNGISRDREYFNITTKAGRTGWVSATTFPEDATVPVDEVWRVIKANINPFGRDDNNKFQRDMMHENRADFRDRDWVAVERKVLTDYFGAIYQEGISADGSTYTMKTSGYGGLTPKAMSMAKGVGLTVPAKWQTKEVIHGKIITKKGDLKTLDEEVTLLNVIYAPEVTIIQLDVSNKDMMLRMGADFSSTLTDLETGKSFNLLCAEMGNNSTEFILIYPPTQSRHFAVTQASKEMKEKMKKKIAKMETVIWDFPEVKVGNLPVQKTVAETKLQKEKAGFKPFTVKVEHRLMLEAKDGALDGHQWVEEGEVIKVVGLATERAYEAEYHGKKYHLSMKQMKANTTTMQ